MTIYFKKTWGWEPPIGPLVFSQEGARDNALRDLLKPGDLVVIVGTRGPNTAEPQRGRLLGIIEPAGKAVGALDFPIPKRPVDFDKDGQFRWPFGIHVGRAWALPDGPDLVEVSQRKFFLEGVVQLAAFTTTEAARVMALRKEPVDVLPPSAAAAAALQPKGTGHQHSPVPAGVLAWMVSRRRRPAFTYAFSIQSPSGPAFKIGWAFNWKQRLRQFNRASLPDFGGLRYEGHLFHLWDTAMTAYLMEQSVLRSFAASRHPANHEVVVGVAAEKLDATWFKLVAQFATGGDSGNTT